VISKIGDGSFPLMSQQVSTILRHGTRPIIALVNDHGYIIEDATHEGP
jgi:indolepyruvate decarboxylase